MLLASARVFSVIQPNEEVSMEIRKFRETDLRWGFLETLSSLSQTGRLPIEEWCEIYRDIAQNSACTIFVAVEGVQVIGTITLLIERKFIHGGGRVGHIEDVAVRKDFQGRGIGRKLVEHAVEYAAEQDCYKVILDCSEDNVPFYERCGFRRHEIGMRKDVGTAVK